MSTVFSRTTNRRDGHLREPQRLNRYLRRQQWPTAIATAEQVHRVRIAVVPPLAAPRTFRGADGLLTDAPRQPLGIFTADCVPVFVSAGRGRVVGLLHAGWRGVQGGIVKEAFRLIWRRWRIAPRLTEFWVGPAIGPCCFEVQWDAARHFPASRARQGDRWRVDLADAIQRQVRRFGGRWKGARSACTRCDGGYFSYRAGDEASRQISLIMKES